MPQNLAEWAMQVAVAVGTAIDVEDLVLGEGNTGAGKGEDVVVGSVEVPGGVEVLWVVVVEREVERELGVLELELELPPGVRYQFTSGSPRHSPAVTPFQPFAWMRPK